jgi:folate-dependent phosphoribosylglycinamide formyltransferase PurN
MLTVARRDDATLHEFRVALLCSRRAPGLPHLLDAAQATSWRIVVGVTSDPDSEAPGLLEGAGIPALVHDITAFYRARGARLSDLGLRRDYDRGTVELLRPFRPDLVVLCGYLHVATAPLLEAHPSRIINVHDSDLAIADGDGLPRYRGLHATRDAIFAGEPETRSTVHLVTQQVDVGPLLVRSWAFPTHPLVRDARRLGAADILKAYAYAQREWMARAAWGPLLARAIELFARGDVRVHSDGVVVGGSLGPEELEPDREREPAALAGMGD